MKKKILILMVGFLLIGVNTFAADGDLIVDGKVGIGMTPRGNYPLEISAPYELFLTILRPSNSQAMGVSFEPQGSITPTNVLWRIGVKKNKNDFRIWYYDGSGVTHPFTVKDTGDVGIGKTNPQGYKLYVNGTAYATGGWQSSDKRFKRHIASINNALNKVLKLKGVSYEWKTDEYKDKGFPEGRHYGVIGQEIEEVLPEIVKEGLDGEKSVSYTEIIPVLIEAVKEQQRIIEKQQKAMEVLKSKVQQLETEDFIAKIQ